MRSGLWFFALSHLNGNSHRNAVAKVEVQKVDGIGSLPDYCPGEPETPNFTIGIQQLSIYRH